MNKITHYIFYNIMDSDGHKKFVDSIENYRFKKEPNPKGCKCSDTSMATVRYGMLYEIWIPSEASKDFEKKVIGYWINWFNLKFFLVHKLLRKLFPKWYGRNKTKYSSDYRNVRNFKLLKIEQKSGKMITCGGCGGEVDSRQY